MRERGKKRGSFYSLKLKDQLTKHGQKEGKRTKLNYKKRGIFGRIVATFRGGICSLSFGTKKKSKTKEKKGKGGFECKWGWYVFWTNCMLWGPKKDVGSAGQSFLVGGSFYEIGGTGNKAGGRMALDKTQILGCSTRLMIMEGGRKGLRFEIDSDVRYTLYTGVKIHRSLNWWGGGGGD